MNDRLKLINFIIRAWCNIYFLDDNEQANSKCYVMRYLIFKFCGYSIWRKNGGQTDEFVTEHEYIHVYRKVQSFYGLMRKYLLQKKDLIWKMIEVNIRL